MKQVFNTTKSDLEEHNGTTGVIIRELTKDEADSNYEGMMYKFKLSSGDIIDVYEEELS